MPRERLSLLDITKYFPMTVFRIFITMLLFFFSDEVYCQLTSQQILKLSKKYYQSLNKFSIVVQSRFKNMIIIDTLSHFTECYIDKSSRVMIFKTKEKAYVKVDSHEYSVNSYQGSFSKTKNKYKKHSAWESEYSQYPFTQTESFFDEIEKRGKKQFKVTEYDSIYLLESQGTILAFRKSDYSVKSSIELIYDEMHKGFQFSQSLFGAVKNLDSSDEETIANIESIMNDPSKDITNIKRAPMPEYIDRVLLERNLTHILNGSIQTLKGKTVFLDFFYQGCLPCVKSYPHVNALFKAADSNLVVIGVDQLIEDTSTIAKYIDKYSLLYPILIGQQAVFLRKYFKLYGFPVFLVLNADGKLIEFGDGFTQNSFKRLTRKLLKER